MKRFITTILICITAIAAAQAQTDELTQQPQKNSWGAGMKQSNFHMGLDLQTKYVWRGMEMMTVNSAPVLFPSVSYSSKGFYVYAMGGYAVNGQYAEVDLGVSYTWKWLTIALNDYYYPSTTSALDNYFTWNRTSTGHWLEGAVTVAPEKIPAYLTVSNFFYGADKTADGRQAYSTYIEIGTYYDFLDNNRLSLALGAACNKSCYNGYERGFSICNIELKYTYDLTFRSGWSIPLNVAYIINPINRKPFVNFSTSLAF